MKAAQTNVKEIRRKQKEHEKILAAMTETRAYSTASLGADKPKGGTIQNQKNRFDVLDRIRSVSYLTPPAERYLGSLQRDVGQ